MLKVIDKEQTTMKKKARCEEERMLKNEENLILLPKMRKKLKWKYCQSKGEVETSTASS